MYTTEVICLPSEEAASKANCTQTPAATFATKDQAVLSCNFAYYLFTSID